MKLIVTESYEESSRVAADLYKNVIEHKRNALIGLATGSTPIGLYECLVDDYKRGLIDFSEIRTVNLDEYEGLARDHDQSFGYFMDQHFFSKVNLKEENIFLVDGAADAAKQEKRFNDFLKDNKIDIQILGIGNNGHIGFNEPDSFFTASAHKVELAEETIKANARFFEKESDVPRSAITMGMYGIATAAKVILVATGAAKAPAIKKLLESDHVDPQLPCSILHICEDATVIVDKDLYELTK